MSTKIRKKQGHRRIKWRLLCASLACAGCVLSNAAIGAEAEFEVYGFAQADYIQDFGRVDPAWDDTLRPTRIETDATDFGTDNQAVISVRQSRFGVNATLPVNAGQIKTKFEFDLFGVGVDEGQTTIRLRHAYGEWGQWLAGQTHSLFMDNDVFPNVIDYWGPAGMVFLRTPQIRWMPVKTEGFMMAVAIEKPSNDIDTGQIPELVRSISPDFGGTIQNDEKVPDLTGQVRINGGFGHLQLSGILRRVGFETIGTPENNPKGFDVGWGTSLTSGVKFLTKDRLLLSGTYGKGIASYMNDGGVDLAPEGGPGALSAETVPLWGISAYIDHYWGEKWSTSIGYARTQVDNRSFQSGDAFQRGEYASVNLLHTPMKNALMGLELLWGQRVNFDQTSGQDIRSQVSFKYTFSSKDFPIKL